MNSEVIFNQLIEIVVQYGPKFFGALLVLLLGSWLIRLIMRGVRKMMDRSNMDASLKPFLKSLVRTILRALLIISVLGMVGIEMTSFIAILGAAGLAVGMALSGTLQNFAGGVMILLFKPYKVGDVLETQGYIGSVKEIQIFNTILTTGDNKTVIIPNGGLSNSSMTNYSTQETRRVEWTFGIGYGGNVDEARQVIRRILDEDERILQDPVPLIAVSNLAESSVDLVTRGWVKTADFWAVYFDINEKVYNAFNQAGINFPFPQMDVHIQK